MEVLQKNLTYQEFRQMEFDENDQSFYELINGELVRKQSPTLLHQRISRRIFRALDKFALATKTGEALYAPLDVVLDDNNAYHPDVIFVRNERAFVFNNDEQIVIGAPDLVVEILSKSTAIYDKGIKKDIYEKYGVREYWLVDQRAKTVELYSYVGQRYALIAYFEETGTLKSSAIEGFEMEIAAIFEAEE